MKRCAGRRSHSATWTRSPWRRDRGSSAPRSSLHDERLVFSFSGLKTAVLYALRGQDARSEATPLGAELISNLAASFQEAVVDVLVAKTRQALIRSGLNRLGVGGGVAANSR